MKQPVAAVSDLWCGRPSGLMQKLSSAKLVVQEPHNVSGEVFEEAIDTYRCEMCIRVLVDVLNACFRYSPFPGCHKLLPCWSQVSLDTQRPTQALASFSRPSSPSNSLNAIDQSCSLLFAWAQFFFITQASCCGSASYAVTSKRFWPNLAVEVQLLHGVANMDGPEIGLVAMSASNGWVTTS